MTNSLRRSLCLRLFLGLIAAQSVRGQHIVLDFEDGALPEETPITSRYAPLGVTFGILPEPGDPCGLAPIIAVEGGINVAFSSSEGADTPMASGERGLADPRIFPASAPEQVVRTIIATFSPAVVYVSMKLSDVEGPENVTVTAYDGNVVVSTCIVAGGSDGSIQPCAVAAARITSITIRGSNSVVTEANLCAYGIDDFEFELAPMYGQQTIIDFEDGALAEETPVTLQYASLGVVFSLVTEPGDACDLAPIIAVEGGVKVAFESTQGIDTPMASGDRGLSDPRIFPASAPEQVVRTIVATFSPAVNHVAMKLSDVEGPESVTVTAYQWANAVDTCTVSGGSDGSIQSCDVTGQFITSVTILGANSVQAEANLCAYAIDDFQFESIPRAVPTIGQWGLIVMGAGLLVLGGRLAKRNRTQLTHQNSIA